MLHKNGTLLFALLYLLCAKPIPHSLKLRKLQVLHYEYNYILLNQTPHAVLEDNAPDDAVRLAKIRSLRLLRVSKVDISDDERIGTNWLLSSIYSL